MTPNWAREIKTLLPVASHFVVSGNVHDRFLVEDTPAERSIFAPLPEVVERMLQRRGIPTLITCGPAEACAVVPNDPQHLTVAEEALGKALDLTKAPDLNGLASLVELVSSARPVGLLVSGASRLVRDPGNLSDAEFKFFRRIEAISRRAQPTQELELFNPVIWVLDREEDFPNWFTSSNTSVRRVVVPIPDADDRERAAERFLSTLAHDAASTETGPDPVKLFAAHSAGLNLRDMRSIVSIAEDQQLDADHIEDAVRSYRVGILENPWRRRYIAERLRAQYMLDPPPQIELLSRRVIGQDHAVQKSLDILVRSVVGLTGAQAATSATRPRGVLFFAGPTGVGKTELAKALTKMLFDDESFYIRFDMSEFSLEQAADRLIGSPPGYVGHAAGGELTNAMRQRPFSVVLFDEIEKAHFRILDKFLQVLDEGRLTDGRGDTAFFTESVIIFTSNLGIYVDQEVETFHGSEPKRRKLNVSPGTPHSELSDRVKAAIKDFFTDQIGRPELLNRIGDNIVVFDFITPDVGVLILDQMLRRVCARVEAEHHITLDISAVRDKLCEWCVNEVTLELGGRGIGNRLETVFINPLAHQLFVKPPSAGKPVAATNVTDTPRGFEVELRCK